MGEVKGPLSSRRRTCSVEGCARSAIPTWPWCEEHRPRFEGPVPHGYRPRRNEDRAREAVRRWPDWDDESLAAAASVPEGVIRAVRSTLGILRSTAI